MSLTARLALVATLALPVLAGAVDGELDPTFGASGIVTLPGTASNPVRCGALAVRPDGRIVIAGAGRPPSATFGVLFQLRSDGGADTAFDLDGTVVVSSVNGETVRGYGGVALRPDGALVVTGEGTADPLGSTTDPVVVRHDASGAVDPSFGSGGISVLLGSVAGGFLNSHPRLDADGTIVVGGRTASEEAFVARLESDGALDAGFDGNGVAVATFFPFAFPDASDQIILPDGKVIVGIGGSLFPIGPAGVLARYDANGGLDTTFGSGGFPFTVTSTVAGLARQPDGKLILARYAEVAPLQSAFSLARFDAGGALDPSFGTGGFTVAPATTGVSTVSTLVAAVVLQRDGKIVVGGTVDGDPTLARFLPDGTLDPAFGEGGVVQTDLPEASELLALELQPDGKLVGVGLSGDHASFVARWGCEDCTPEPSECTPAPRSDCKAPSLPGKSTLSLAAGATDPKDRLQWKWSKGTAVTPAELGNALVTTSYSLCVYDESGPPELIAGSSVPPGGTCGGKPCWKALGAKGFRRADRAGTNDGQIKTLVKAGAVGVSSAQVKAKGEPLTLPTLPLALPLRVQLQASDGTCLEATYSAAGLGRNDAARFKARSD